MIKRIIHLFTFCFALLLLTRCEKETPLPDNPYDDIDYGDTIPIPYSLEKNSIGDLHKRVFQTKCAQPGCHDGNFEPDFRSVHSSYSTMVYHPIVKNNVANDFTYRVVPGNTAQSVLYERITNCCFVNQNDRMPQDNIGVPLPEEDVADIADWINKGARDPYGNPGRLPNAKPTVNFFVAFKADFSEFYSTDESNRIDGIAINPFLMPNNTSVTIAISVEDDSTLVKDLKLNQLKLSTEMNDFTNAIVKTCTYFSVPGQGEFWLTTFNTNTLATEQTYYLRYFVHDGNPQNLTEFPYDELPDFYKSFAAFQIRP